MDMTSRTASFRALRSLRVLAGGFALIALAGGCSSGAASDSPSCSGDSGDCDHVSTTVDALSSTGSVAGCSKVVAYAPAQGGWGADPDVYTSRGSAICPALGGGLRYKLEIWMEVCLDDGQCLLIGDSYRWQAEGFGDGSPWWSDHGWDIDSARRSVSYYWKYRTKMCVRVIRSDYSIDDEGGCVYSPRVDVY